MNHIDDPRRLFERNDVPAELRSLLQRAQADGTSDAAAEQLVRAVVHRTHVEGAVHSHGVRRSWVARHSTKLFLAAVVMGVGAGGAYWAGQNNGLNPRPDPVPTLVGAERPRVPVEAPAGQAATTLTQPPSVARSPAVSNGVTPPRPRTRAGRALAAVPETDTAVSIESAGETTGAGEFRLLRAARQALADHPARALGLTDDHARRFARGMLAQEREAIAVEALVQLGREGQAKVRAQAFFVSYPSSPYRSRVERAITQQAGAPSSP